MSPQKQAKSEPKTATEAWTKHAKKNADKTIPTKHSRGNGTDQEGHYDIDGASLDVDAGIVLGSAEKPATPAQSQNDNASGQATPS